jgi:hypothetical protein
MASSFRHVTPTDVDRFIQFPDALEVDARDITLTTDEDIYADVFETKFSNMDYVIICEVENASFFNAAMDWKYRVDLVVDPSGGAFLGPHLSDAHSPLRAGAPVLASDVLVAANAKQQLEAAGTPTRFAHYRLANTFLKYSFRVGDVAALADGRAAQLYAVYFDSATGQAMPYWRTTSDAASQDAETKVFYYADETDVVLSALTDASGSSVRFGADAVTVVAPPDPEYLENGPITVGRNLAYAKDASGSLAVRTVGFLESEGSQQFVAGVTPYPPASFVRYTSDAGRELMLYWVVYPPSDKLHLGEKLYVSWSSKALGLGAADESVAPIRDIVDASGIALNYPIAAELIKNADRVVFTTPVSASVPKALEDLVSLSMQRMYLPTSKISVVDTVSGQLEPLDVPFSYEVANETQFADSRQCVLGGRFMQLLSYYLFDSATAKEIAYFPFFINESKELTDKIVDGLAASFKRADQAGHEARNHVLNQLVVKYGRRYFDEYAIFNEALGYAEGSVGDVLARLGEMFVTFTVTVRTTVSQRSKDRVDMVKLVNVPVAIRVYKGVP